MNLFFLFKKNYVYITVMFCFLSLVLFIKNFFIPRPQFIKLASEQTPPIVHLNTVHLFGEYDHSLDDLPVTTLPLALQGAIVTTNDASQSFAIIAKPNHPASMYRVGDTLPDNTVITRIHQQSVVLNHNGRLEELMLPIQYLSLQRNKK